MTKLKHFQLLNLVLVSVLASSLPALSEESPGGPDGVSLKLVPRELAAIQSTSPIQENSAWSEQQVQQERLRYSQTLPQAQGSAEKHDGLEPNLAKAQDQRTEHQLRQNAQLCGFSMGYRSGYSRGWYGAVQNTAYLFAASSKGGKSYPSESAAIGDKTLAELNEWYMVDLRDSCSAILSAHTERNSLDLGTERISLETGFHDAYWDAALAATQDWADVPSSIRYSGALTKEDVQSKRYRRAGTALYAYADRIGAPYPMAADFLKPLRPEH